MSSDKLRGSLALLAFLALCGITGYLVPMTLSPDNTPVFWYSIVPPLLAITLALATRRVILSLFLGVLVGGLLVAYQQQLGLLSIVIQGPITASSYIFNAITDPWNIQVLLFLVLILATITITICAGGLQGLITWLSAYAHDGRSAQVVAYILGMLIFIDDYANTLLVGTSMRPITDKFKVSREKLAFIVDATSAPVSGIAFVSTWVGYEVGQFTQVAERAGIDRDGYAIFFDIFTLRFYCILMLIFLLINVLSRRDYGAMRSAQVRAATLSQISAPDAKQLTSRQFTDAQAFDNVKVNLWTAVIPLVGLLLYFVAGLWVDGGGMARLAEQPFALFSISAWSEVVSASKNNMKVLMESGLLGFVLALLCARFIAQVNYRSLLKAIWLGINAARLPIIILTLAWSLKSACDGLSTDIFLIELLGDNFPALLFPAMVFAMAGMTAIATGTSWGTMAILIPMVAPLAVQLDGGSYGIITMLSLAAVLDGSIFGDHCSPLSDTTIMSSIASSCDHMHHVRTQFPYALTVALFAFMGYLIMPLGIIDELMVLGVSTLLFVALFFGVLRRWQKSV